MTIDQYLFRLINGFTLKYIWLDTVAIFFATYAGYALLLTIPIFLLLRAQKYWPMVWQGLIAAFFSRFIVAEIIRFFIARPRPFVNGNIIPLVGREPLYDSFPSGHATFYFALSTVFYLYNKKAGVAFLLASSAIALARVFVGVHWPTDVVGGAVIGILSGWLVVSFAPSLVRRFK